MTGALLRGKKGLVIGIANEHSIAYGCAHVFREMGATLALTYLNSDSYPYVKPLAERLDAPLLLACDFRIPGQLEAVFEKIKNTWGELDFVLHSVAYAPREDLQARVTDCSKEGFSTAMDLSCHSFIRIAKQSEPLMKKGGCLLAVSFYGAEKVVKYYNLMGPVKAALESTVRYLAIELASQNIRVHALSPGPIKTRAASGLDRFDELMEMVKKRVPNHKLVTIEEVGSLAAFLVSDAAKSLTGNIEYIDGGYHTLG